MRVIPLPVFKRIGTLCPAIEYVILSGSIDRKSVV